MQYLFSRKVRYKEKLLLPLYLKRAVGIMNGILVKYNDYLVTRDKPVMYFPECAKASYSYHPNVFTFLYQELEYHRERTKQKARLRTRQQSPPIKRSYSTGKPGQWILSQG